MRTFQDSPPEKRPRAPADAILTPGIGYSITPVHIIPGSARDGNRGHFSYASRPKNHMHAGNDMVLRLANHARYVRADEGLNNSSSWVTASRIYAFPYRARQTLGRAVERLDLQTGWRIFRRPARERLLEEFRIDEINLDDKPLACDIKVQTLDGSERGGVQKPFGRLAGLLDVLVQHACRVVRRLDHEGIAFPTTDRVAERISPRVFRMSLHIHVHNAPDVHPFVTQHDISAVSRDFKRSAGCAPNTPDRNRIAAERRIISKRIVCRVPSTPFRATLAGCRVLVYEFANHVWQIQQERTVANDNRLEAIETLIGAYNGSEF